MVCVSNLPPHYSRRSQYNTLNLCLRSQFRTKNEPGKIWNMERGTCSQARYHRRVDKRNYIHRVVPAFHHADAQAFLYSNLYYTLKRIISSEQQLVFKRSSIPILLRVLICLGKVQPIMRIISCSKAITLLKNLTFVQKVWNIAAHCSFQKPPPSACFNPLAMGRRT